MFISLKKKILVLSRDIGGVQAILPVVCYLSAVTNIQIYVMSMSVHVNVYHKYGVDVKIFDYERFSSNRNMYVRELLEKFEPNMLLLGSSPSKLGYPETPEQISIICSKEMDVLTLSIQDFWGMYEERYCNEKGVLDEKLIPDKLCVLDSISYKHLVDFGIGEEKLKITHNPWFDTIASESVDIELDLIEAIKGKGLVILFVSQPLIETNTLHKRTYDQETILEGVVEALYRLPEKENTHMVIIWSHPSEDSNRWDDLYKWQKSNVRVEFSEDRGGKILSNVDLVVTSHSTVAYEALYYGTPCVSYRPNDKNSSLLITEKLGLLKSFTTIEELASYLSTNDFSEERQSIIEIKKSYLKKRSFFSDGYATHRVVQEVGGLLNISIY